MPFPHSYSSCMQPKWSSLCSNRVFHNLKMQKAKADTGIGHQLLAETTVKKLIWNEFTENQSQPPLRNVTLCFPFWRLRIASWMFHPINIASWWMQRCHLTDRLACKNITHPVCQSSPPPRAPRGWLDWPKSQARTGFSSEASSLHPANPRVLKQRQDPHLFTTLIFKTIEKNHLISK